MTIYLETETKLLVLQSDAPGPAGRFESVGVGSAERFWQTVALVGSGKELNSKLFGGPFLAIFSPVSLKISV